MTKRSRAICLIMTFILMCMSITGFISGDVYARAIDEDSPMKVKVGFFKFRGYHEIDENGIMSGYGYDFLQMIAPYANFDYEYVGYDKSWAEMQQMLENGEIDILTSAHKTPERLEKFDFTNKEIGYSATMIAALPSNSKFSINDYSTFEGIHVGMTSNNSRNESFEGYAKKNGFHYNSKYYESQSEMMEALHRGEIDVTVSSDLIVLEDEIIIDKFDEESYYAIVKKGNDEILGRLNKAISNLNADAPNWINVLATKYYNSRMVGKDAVLNGIEQEYINSLNSSNVKLKVLLRPERAPYSYFENGEAKGIFVDILQDVTARYNIPYELIETASLNEYVAAIDNNEPDIVFDSTFDYYQAEQAGYNLTGVYHTAQFCELKRNDFKGTPKKFAILSGLPTINRGYEQLYNNRETFTYPSTKDCVQAVFDKKVDATYLYMYTALKYASEDSTGFLIYSPLRGTTTSFSIAVRDGTNPVLFSVMSRIASGIGEDDIQTAISDNTQFGVSTNQLLYFIYHQPLLFSGIIAALIGILLIAVNVKTNREKRKALIQKQEKEEQARILEEAYNAADKANKAKSTFLSNISHDIRTPMNVIIGMSAIAEANVGDKTQVTDCLSKITVASRHLLSLINEVLDMSKIESGKFTLTDSEFNIVQLFDNLQSMISTQAKDKHQELIVKAEGIEHADVIGDSLRLQQVFVNIAGNAVKYTPDGGKIEITATELKYDNTQCGKYKFVFKDNGVGMKEDYLKKIFEPFSRESRTTVASVQGTGLGMAITKYIVELMEGTIDVESTYGEGSVFTVILKFKLQEKSHDADDKDKLSGQSTSDAMDELKITDYSSKRILIVEDFEMNMIIIKRILSTTGIQIEEAANGKQAVDMFEQSDKGYYDMIFMDICMPEMDGYEATKAIRALDREDASTVPIVALTADAFAEDVDRALKAGMNEHLAKPLEIPKVTNILKQWLS